MQFVYGLDGSKKTRTGMTDKKFAVLGDPIEHSMSPAIHLAAYKVLGFDWNYEKIQVHSGGLNEFVAHQGSHFQGFSVTMPLKAEAAALAVNTDPLVQRLGIANTLIRTASGLNAFNTDVFGITKALDDCWVTNPQRVAILGAGATARSAILALHLKAPSSHVSVYVRSSSNTSEITDLAKTLDLDISVQSLTDFSDSQDLTINTIPGEHNVTSSDKQSGWLLDVNYSNPDKTLNELFDSLKVVSGKDMLLWQAIAQIRLFIALDASKELPNEVDVLRAMSAAL